jgi:hypothetical protein
MPQVALVLLLLAGQLADEDVVFVDHIHAEPAEFPEPLSTILPVSREIMGLDVTKLQAELGLDLT